MAGIGRVRTATLAILVAGWAMLSACALKAPPDLAQVRDSALPNAPLPAGWLAAPVDTAPVSDGWLTTLGDSALVALVVEAIEHNPDVEVAAARMERAAGQLKLAGGKMKPFVDIYARGGSGMGGDGSGLNGALVLASWEVDLWGRVRYGREAARAGHTAAAADLIYARQSLAAMVAKSWYLAAELRLQHRITDSLVGASSRLVELTERQRQVGIADDQAVAVVRTDLGSYRDRQLQIEQSEQEARRALEILAGRYPAATLDLPDSLPATIPPVPAGLPLGLLERRPDLIAANFRIASAFYARGQAVAAKLPTLSLTANFGAVSSDMLTLSEDFSNPVFSLGANLLAPIFRGGELQAQVDIRTAEQRAAVAEYGGAALAAFRDVENALGAEQMLQRRQVILEELVRDGARAVEVSAARYAVGREDLLTGLQYRVRLFSSQLALIRVRSERMVQRINLHLALGGGFVMTPVDTVSATR
jgi:NodT family efflux transporter outer membrane factor (OMF) lipoprotein